MSDATFMLLAAVVLAVVIWSAFQTPPERRNPHVNARRPWWRRMPN